jgi:hypothetical protein
MLLVAVGMASFSAYDLSSERLADRRASSFLDFCFSSSQGLTLFSLFFTSFFFLY